MYVPLIYLRFPFTCLCSRRQTDADIDPWLALLLHSFAASMVPVVRGIANRPDYSNLRREYEDQTRGLRRGRKTWRSIDQEKRMQGEAEAVKVKHIGGE